MAPERPGSLEVANKRQKLNHKDAGIYAKSLQFRSAAGSARLEADPSSNDGVPTTETQTIFSGTTLINSPFDIANYIPAGCLRVSRVNTQITEELWSSQSSWAALRIVNDSHHDPIPVLLSDMVAKLLLTSVEFNRYACLLDDNIIGAEFRANNLSQGQIRIYLPEDGKVRQKTRNGYRKSSRKALKELLRNLDISPVTWNGDWTDDVPIAHINASLDTSLQVNHDETLLELFNSLPSPQPRSEVVEDAFAKMSMAQLLSGEVPGLETIMYPYQRRSAALMVQRETIPGLVIDPRLTKLKDQTGLEWYCDPENLTFKRHPRMYDAPRGGILAENMGLGKTLICLALILATRAQPTMIPPELSIGLVPVRKKTGSLLNMAAAALGRHAMPWKDELSSAEEIGYEYIRIKEAIRSHPGHYYISSPSSSRSSRSLKQLPEKVLISTCTLIVVPANLLQQWLNEIHKHTKGLRVLVLKDMRAEVPPAVEILDYDILLFTKGRFDKEAKTGQLTQTPLRNIRFKRLIYDEGHTFGNASNSSQTEAFTLVNALQISARWIVSGTPSQGLYSTGVSGSTTPIPMEGSDQTSQLKNDAAFLEPNSKLVDNKLLIEQERKDLIRLGNIAMFFLKVRPWAHSSDGDVAVWQQYALQPRHGEKSHGNMACLKTTLEGMMVRHSLADVDTDVQLPPLYEDIVYLEPCVQNQFALNIFNLMIITNAITSERKDADYFFHPKQLKNLQALVSNLRQASFFWSGFELEHLKGTISIGQKFLDDALIPTSIDDKELLTQAIAYGEAIISNDIFQKINQWHEMPMYLENSWPEVIRSLLAMDESTGNPTLLAPCMLFDAQKYIHKTSHPTPQRLIIEAHHTLLANGHTQNSSNSHLSNRTGVLVNQSHVATSQGPRLAGGVTLGHDPSPKKLSRSQNRQISEVVLNDYELQALYNLEHQLQSVELPKDSGLSDANHTLSTSTNNPPSSMIANGETQEEGRFNDDRLTKAIHKFLTPSQIISTASTKLSYLLDRIILYHKEEKILVFYEDPNTAYYIAQYLECLNIKHLIYARELTPEKRSRYVATFNTTETFRVLLMDVSQAAFGLDVSSASRVYFINPVFSPQVEAQAVKRAHRIGQTRPVYVETLVLKGSIEEVLVARRNVVSKEEHQKFKSILDDQTVYDWIRNVKLLPMDLKVVSGPEQMAPLQTPQPAFGKGSGSGYGADPDAEIVKVNENLPNGGSLREKSASLNGGGLNNGTN